MTEVGKKTRALDLATATYPKAHGYGFSVAPRHNKIIPVTVGQNSSSSSSYEADVAEVYERFRLTQRERAVVELLIQGLTNKEIAGRINISPNTVRAFVRMVMIKFGVSTRAGIVGIMLRGVAGHSRWVS
jgi:DNA-binding CsgD family transcriptional regulator